MLAGDPSEDVVEGLDRAREEHPTAAQEIVLATGDIRDIGHDQDGLLLEHLEVAIEQPFDLAGMRRPCDQRETHGLMLVLGPDGSPGELPERAPKTSRAIRGPARRCSRRPGASPRARGCAG